MGLVEEDLGVGGGDDAGEVEDGEEEEEGVGGEGKECEESERE